MKKSGSKSANMYVIFGLLAVLFVSLGYLSMQSKEGMMPGMPKKAEGMMPKKAGFKGGREGLTAAKKAENKALEIPGLSV
jgi:hypothetical protein